MSFIEKFIEKIEEKEAEHNLKYKQYEFKHFVLTLDEMKELFGDNFLERSIPQGISGCKFQLFIHESDRVYFVRFSTFDDETYEFDGIPNNGSHSYYTEVGDEYLQSLMNKREQMLKEIQMIEEVFEHPKNRLKILFM